MDDASYDKIVATPEIKEIIETQLMIVFLKLKAAELRLIKGTNERTNTHTDIDATYSIY